MQKASEFSDYADPHGCSTCRKLKGSRHQHQGGALLTMQIARQIENRYIFSRGDRHRASRMAKSQRHRVVQQYPRDFHFLNGATKRDSCA